MQLENINKVPTCREIMWRPTCCRPSVTSTTRWSGQMTCYSGSSCSVGHSPGQEKSDSYSSILGIACEHELQCSEIQICSSFRTLQLQPALEIFFNHFLISSGEDCDDGALNCPLWLVIKVVSHESSLSCWGGVPDIRFQHLDRHQPVLLWLDRFNVSIDNSLLLFSSLNHNKCQMQSFMRDNLSRSLSMQIVNTMDNLVSSKITHSTCVELV